MAYKALSVAQVLLTIVHDGRYSGKQGGSLLVEQAGNRLWSLDGVQEATAREICTVGESFITIPTEQYAKFLAIEAKLKEIENQAAH